MRAAHDTTLPPYREKKLDRIGSMGSVRISVEDLEKVSKAFVDDFSSGKMDYKIHRFPAGLRGVGDRYIVPMVVAIGPYHRASDHLGDMEAVKRAAFFRFIKGWKGKRPEEVYDAVLSVADDARKFYAADAVVGMEDHDFAAMMFLDACFLLHYMDAYSCFKSNKVPKVDETLRRFLFTNRACINNDIMLLENQLPWMVLQTVIDSLSPHKNYMKVVEEYIEAMGKTFEIDAEDKKGTSSGGVSNNGLPTTPPTTPPPPQHLLALLRRHKTEPGTGVDWPKVARISASSAIELAEIGVKLKASNTALFTDMDVRERGLFCGELSLAPLSLNDTRACWLVNMAAFEVSTASTFRDDHPNKTAVCSYLALLGMSMLREEDVHELRSKRILYGHQTNAEMLTFFKTVIKLLPDTGSRFAHVMARIEDYKAKRWMRTKVHRFVYTNLSAIIQVVTIVGTLAGIFQAFPFFSQGQKNDTPGQYLSFLPA